MAALKPATMARLEELFTDFPNRPAALIPALYIVQDEENHLTEENLSALADVLDMPKSAIYETATFYSLFSFDPRGRHIIRLCRSICCYLKGSDRLEEAMEKILGIREGETTPDGRFTYYLSECLAACDRAPMIQINEEIFGPIGPEDLPRILEAFQ
jgi:NADH-quinone oxidoreductase E subunit